MDGTTPSHTDTTDIDKDKVYVKENAFEKPNKEMLGTETTGFTVTGSNNMNMN